MRLLRPEIRAGLLRWREALAGATLALLGLWWALTAFGLVAWIGWAVMLIGCAAALAGIQRGRFRPATGGAGVVQVDERRLAYFGPLTGGIVDLDDLRSLDWDPTGRPAHWRLDGPGGELAIPADALGAEALFDAFAALPGLSPARLVAVQRETERTRLWSRGAIQLR